MDVTTNIPQEDPSQGLQNANSNISPVKIIIVPIIPCHSHLDQLLHLSCLISSTYNIPVHYATSATHLRQAKLRFTSPTLLQNPHIHFHGYPIPTNFISPPPNPNAPNNFPYHFQPAFEATKQLREPVAELLREVSATTTKRVVVIYDALMAYVVQDMASLPNAESFLFSPIPAFHDLLRERLKEDDQKSLPFIEELNAIPSVEACVPLEVRNLVVPYVDVISLSSGTIYNSCRSIEGTFIDLLAKEMNNRNKQIWAVGPLNPGKKIGRKESNGRHKCLEWLDKQEPKSVLYVSFGTTTSMADEQIMELAVGLEQSKQKFIWILRDADRADIFAGDVKRAQLPKGYEEMVKDVGMIVRDWAPQVEILGHPSTGGFMSHCGWNSCSESIAMGVPMAAWPMHSDQHRNAFLVTNILKVGLAVKATEEGDQEMMTSSTIIGAVQRLMASKEGEEMRKRAEDIGYAVQQAVEEGGVSCLELDSFIAHITR